MRMLYPLLVLICLSSQALAQSITIEWDSPRESTEIGGYRIYVARADGEFGLVGSVEGPISNSFSIPSSALAVDKTNYVYVSAISPGPEPLESDPSQILKLAPLSTLHVGLGRASGQNGYVERMTTAGANAGWRQIGWESYRSANGSSTQLARCNIAGDATPELILGLDGFAGQNGKAWLQIQSDAGASLAWISANRVEQPDSLQSSAPLRVACGNVDNDLYAELVVGFGNGSSGWLLVIDDQSSGYRQSWVQVPWVAYRTAAGGTYPAIIDFDGDGKGELVVGLDNFAGNGGWIALFEDRDLNFRFHSWQRVNWTAYNSTAGLARIAGGNVDGDIAEEIVIATDPVTVGGKREAGWFEVKDDLSTGFRSLGWNQVPWASFNGARGRIFPALGDIDKDGLDEILIGLEAYPGASTGGYFEVRDDAAHSFRHSKWLRVNWSAYNQASGETHPIALRD